MKQHAVFKQIFASVALVLLFSFGLSFFSFFQHGIVSAQTQKGTCADDIDNDDDGRADWDGVQGKYPPDPSCINKEGAEVADDVSSKLIPCTNKCDLSSVFQFLNNAIEVLIKFILFPIAIFTFMYAGFKYLTAQGNPSKKANVKKMIGNLILGMVIILTSWIVVKTVLLLLGYDQTLYFFD